MEFSNKDKLLQVTGKFTRKRTIAATTNSTVDGPTTGIVQSHVHTLGILLRDIWHVLTQVLAFKYIGGQPLAATRVGLPQSSASKDI